MLLQHIVIDYPNSFTVHIESRETTLVASDGEKILNTISGSFAIANKRRNILCTPIAQ